MTVAITNYLLERVRNRVDLCELQGGQWITIRSRVSRSDAARYGFNLECPAVQRIFAGTK